MGSVNYSDGRYSYVPPTREQQDASARDKRDLAAQENLRAFQANNQGGSYTVGDPFAAKWANERATASNKTNQKIATLRQSIDTNESGGGQGGQGDLNQSQQNWNSAIDMTRGRGDATMNDPRITAALDRLQKNTEEGPYSPGVVNQMSNRMADRTAAMDAGQTAALREQVANRGGSMNDPSFQAAMNASNTGRMQQNNADRGDLESKATVTNYGAQGQAAQALAGTRLGQLSHADDMYGQAGNMYANAQNDTGQRQSTVPSFAPSFGVSTAPVKTSGGFQSMWTPGTSGGNTGGGGYQTQDNDPVSFKPQLVPKPVPRPVTRPPGYNNLLTGQHITNGKPDGKSIYKPDYSEF